MSTRQDIFANLVDENQGIIHKVCRTYADSDEEHKDMFQEVVLQLWSSFDSFKEESKFSTWMYRVALNTAITLFRKKKKAITTTEIEEYHSHQYKEIVEHDKQEEIDILYKSIKQLTEIERALVLLYLEEKPYKEIAETIGITEGNARVKINRVKVKLKEIMQQWI
ncbi:RNA polymerase sigma-70 factor (ECF subfamily) [Balneicella halophila]|uniref:RNA polymerase sigma-70 factor (ECF subfamily) n=1 Tax=Balneicella halophila TaxID=1537566 RepID=A0A7L4UPC3_BALHA|nr:sigma-70 family RNA polymerase sigma factor [Balneicella halophila]PVX50958.1 RNA polymerase sigma-70 factor (ECF subfamily) [Balneicella halophila]